MSTRILTWHPRPSEIATRPMSVNGIGTKAPGTATMSAGTATITGIEGKMRLTTIPPTVPM